VLNLRLSSMPVTLMFGMCLPSACSQILMDDFGNLTSNKLSQAMTTLLGSQLNPQLYFLPNDTSVSIFFRNVREYDSEWLGNSWQKAGLIVMGQIMLLWCGFILFNSIKGNDSALTIQRGYSDLLSKRMVESAEERDLLMFDGFRVLCLIWILTFGVA
jgi:hypothetical protein